MSAVVNDAYVLSTSQGSDYILWGIFLVSTLLLALYCLLAGYQTTIRKLTE